MMCCLPFRSPCGGRQQLLPPPFGSVIGSGRFVLSACWWLMVCACEDVGLAWPQILPIVKAAVDIALQIGLPEARIPLADAVVLVANAPKSNTAYMGINQAMQDIRMGKVGNIFPGSCKTSIVMVRIGSVRDSFTNILSQFHQRRRASDSMREDRY